MATKFDNIMAWIAQGVVNIDSGFEKVEAQSPVHNAMTTLCQMVNDGEVVHVQKPKASTLLTKAPNKPR